MAIIALCSQKGGVGKSTLARALVVGAVRAGLSAKLADLDSRQRSSADWHQLRLAKEVEPEVLVQSYATPGAALKEAGAFDYFVVDCPGRAAKATAEIARVADLVVQPTGPSLDDLRPAVRLLHELTAAGVPADRLRLALCRIGTPAEERDARAYLVSAGYTVLRGCLMERPAYRSAQGIGRAVTETTFRSLNKPAAALVDAIAEELE